MTEDTNERRLPPPAFPPGHRRHAHRNSDAKPEGTRAGDRPPAVVDADEAMISPDDPIPPRRDPIEQAFIAPDEPLPERAIELTPDFARHAPPPPDEEGQVVGMDMDSDAEPHEVRSATDPHVAELTGAVTRLGEALRRRGEAGLRVTPGMSRFDATLRAYCVGYLAGRRAEALAQPPREED